MGKKMMKCCALAAFGAMVFGGFGGCLGPAWKFFGQGLVGGAGFETGRDMVQTYVLSPWTHTQDAVNDLDYADALQAEIERRAE